jgi:arylsulfatase A-like enzyme
MVDVVRRMRRRNVSDRCACSDRPNIVFLFADNAGYTDFGFQPDSRNEMKKLTPHIDSIARDGARFKPTKVSGWD